MTKNQTKKIREQLEAKLAEVSGNGGRRDELITEWSNDPMDQIQSRADLDLTVRFVNTDFQTKRQVQTAMALLENGEYGICQECGEEINPKRLEAIPWTTVCVSCQEELDEVGGDSDFRRAA
ncbi:MAG: hypothetical protein GC160_11940 [Acidobacteria bacterium]|nr:hypothetical protein [Acidobacteriota bacterium]